MSYTHTYITNLYTHIFIYTYLYIQGSSLGPNILTHSCANVCLHTQIYLCVSCSQTHINLHTCVFMHVYVHRHKVYSRDTRWIHIFMYCFFT